MGCGGGKHEYDKHSESHEFAKMHPERVLNESPVVYPAYWAETGSDDSAFHKLVDVTSDESSELLEVQALLNHTFDVKKTASQLKVVELLRVEDSKLWADYEHSIAWITKCRSTEKTPVNKMMSEKGEEQEVPQTIEHISEAWKPRIRFDANEVYLWHGTDNRSAHLIAKNDFRIQSAGSAHGKKLGKGAYLAGSSSLADAYAPPDKDEVRTLILVRTALGKVHVTTKRASAWSSNKRVDRTVSTTKLVKTMEWDSVLGDRRKVVGSHREYCVAFAHQLYPEYLVMYKRVP